MRLTLYELYVLLSALECSLKYTMNADCEAAEKGVRRKIRDDLVQKMSEVDIPVEVERYLRGLAKDGKVETMGRFTKAPPVGRKAEKDETG